ncbi:MAG: hypothetical protein RLZZ196_3098, partial [Bacteroidota bacterium]
ITGGDLPNPTLLEPVSPVPYSNPKYPIYGILLRTPFPLPTRFLLSSLASKLFKSPEGIKVLGP